MSSTISPSGGDDTSALTTAIAGASGVLTLNPGTFHLSGPVPVTNGGLRIEGWGANIVQQAAQTPSLHLQGANGTTIEGLTFTGLGTDWNNSGPTDAVGVWVDASAGCKILHSTFTNHGCAGVMLSHASPNLLVSECDITGVGSVLSNGSNYNVGIYGYGSGLQSPGLRLRGNNISGVAQGIFLGADFQQVCITGHLISLAGLGQHGMYLGGLTAATIAGNTIDSPGNAGIKSQLTAADTLGSNGLSITGNTIRNAAVVGILVTRASGSCLHRTVTVANNSVEAPGQYGIYLDACDAYVLAGNAVRSSGAYGGYIDVDCLDGKVCSNTFKGTAWTGLVCAAAAGSRCFVHSNALLDVVGSPPSQLPSQTSGVYVLSGQADLCGNTIRGAAGCQYSVASGLQSSVALCQQLPISLPLNLLGQVRANIPLWTF